MDKTLKILFIEDVQNDAELIWHQISSDKISFQRKLVDTEADYLEALSVFIPDIIISDYKMPHFNGMEALLLKKELAPLTPFILVTGSVNEKIAVECMKAGADDYIIKENLSRLGEAIKSALKKKEIDRQKEITEKKLRASEAHLNAVMQTIPDLIWLKDKDGIYLACNSMFERFFGALESDIIGKTDYDFVDRELADSFREYDRKAMVLGKPSGNEEWITFRDNGRRVCLDTIKTPMIDQSGVLIGVLGTSRDITARKEMEESLKESESRFKSFSESAPVGIFGTDINGVTNYVNPRWCEISKMNSAEALGNGWLSAVHADDRAQIAQAWQQASSTHSTSYSEYRFLHPDGSISWVQGQAVPQKDQNGNLKGYIGTVTDITKGKLAENKLIESEAYYRTLIDISPDGIITTDLEGNVIHGSMKAYEIFNESPDANLTGTSVFNWVDPEYHAFLITRFKDILARNLIPVSREYKLLKHDRSIFWAELSSSPITDSNGNLSGLLIVCRDISGRKKAEEELIKARDNAEEGDRLKTAFLHNISHEIRTPMNAITGFSALLGEPDLNKETIDSYIKIINQSSDHLLFVLNDIIEISNIDAGILKLKKIETKLNALLGRLYNQFRPLAADKEIEFGLFAGLPDREANINVDSGKLIEVLSNLLRNSMKFTLKGTIEFGYKLKNGFLEFFVSDTGIGIPEDQLLKIFNRFYQVEHTETRQYEGTGLGLSISKEYIELMNGKIWLTSNPGSGSVFYFTIPYEEFRNIQIIAQPADLLKIPEITGIKTILIAEDDNNNFRLIKQLLSGLNVEIVHACNGIEAVDICKSGRRIDLVLMDIKMPLMDGYEAARIILLNNRSMKIIVQTAYADDIAKSLEAGCVGFISKPFNRKQFIELMKEFL